MYIAGFQEIGTKRNARLQTTFRSLVDSEMWAFCSQKEVEDHPQPGCQESKVQRRSENEDIKYAGSN